jgi:glycosyltransferase involved in cell wall biosynthesis
MDLLVLSHSCVTSANQRFYATVEDISDWSLTLVGPANWIGDYGRKRSLDRWPTFSGQIHEVPVWLNGNIPLHVYRSTFRSLFHDVAPDAIFVHHEPYAAATAQLYLANQLWHGCPIGFFTWQNIQKSYPPPFRYTEQMVYRCSHFAFTGSESAATVLREKGYDGPSTLLPGSIDPEVYAPTPASDELHEDIGIPPDAVVVGFMGRISRVKGLSTLLHALEILDNLPWHLVLVGEGDYEEEIADEAAAQGISGRVHLTGYVPHTEAPRYLSMFDVLVLPSETQPDWKEQFGRVLIEALACGTPLVGSDSGEIPNVIRRTRGGLSFPEGDEKALAHALRRMITAPSLRERLAEQGRSYVLDEHTNAVLARRFVDTIQTASQQPHSG